MSKLLKYTHGSMKVKTQYWGHHHKKENKEKEEKEEVKERKRK